MISAGSSPATHGGCVVYKQVDDRPLFLLVTPKKKKGEPVKQEWLLPKGHIDLDEMAAETALREAKEEAGVEGDVVDYIDTKEFSVPKEVVRARYFLVRLRKQGIPSEGKREAIWLPSDQAIARASYAEVKDLLRSAEALLAAARLRARSSREPHQGMEEPSRG